MSSDTLQKSSMHYAGRNSVSKYQRRLRWETLNPLLSVRQAELSPCVKAMGEAESEINHVSTKLKEVDYAIRQSYRTR